MKIEEEFRRKNLGKKTKAMNFWSNGGDLYYWDGELLKKWSNEQLIKWDAQWFDYIIKDDKFMQRCIDSWFKYSNGKNLTYNIYQRIQDKQ